MANPEQTPELKRQVAVIGPFKAWDIWLRTRWQNGDLMNRSQGMLITSDARYIWAGTIDRMRGWRFDEIIWVVYPLLWTSENYDAAEFAEQYKVR